MPLYTLQCPDCGALDEHFMGVDDAETVFDCPECGHGVTRKNNRSYMSDLPQIQGDTVAGGCNYSGYWDEGLDCYITSKKHRADEMEKQGVVEYSPDPEFLKGRKEQKYIKDNSKPGDADAAKAIQKEKHAASVKRRTAVIDKVFDDAPLPTLPDV